HPQRLSLGGLGRLEEEAAGSGGERPEQGGLPLAAPSADDTQSPLGPRVGGEVGQRLPLPLPAEDVRGFPEDVRHRTEVYLTELYFTEVRSGGYGADQETRRRETRRRETRRRETRRRETRS